MLAILHTSISTQRMVSQYHFSVLCVCLLSSALYLPVNLKYELRIWCMSTEHFKPVLEQILKLEEALYNIQFEQHWLEAQTDRQAIGKNYKLNLLFAHINYEPR